MRSFFLCLGFFIFVCLVNLQSNFVQNSFSKIIERGTSEAIRSEVSIQMERELSPHINGLGSKVDKLGVLIDELVEIRSNKQH